MRKVVMVVEYGTSSSIPQVFLEEKKKKKKKKKSFETIYRRYIW